MIRPVSHRRTRKSIACAGASALTFALLAAGCAEELVPELAAVPEETVATPALSDTQFDRILAEVNESIAEADGERDPELLTSRVTGPALTVRTSQLNVAEIRDDDSLVTLLPDTFQQIIVPTTATWPRTMFAITDVGDEFSPPRLLALTQDDPRDDYQLWAWVQLRPGVLMPAFAHVTIGSEELAENDTSLRFTPAEAVEQYADLLTNGDDSEYVDNFEPAIDDPFRTFLYTWVTAQQEALDADRVEGTFSLEVVPMPGEPVKAIRAANLDSPAEPGGAMVMAALVSSEQLEAMEGAVLTPQTQTAQALLEGATFTNVLTATYTDMIALYIPPAGSTEPIKLLGYSHVQTGASVELPEAVTEEEEAEDGEAEASEEGAGEDEATDEATAEDDATEETTEDTATDEETTDETAEEPE